MALPAEVLLLNAEDDPARTLRPRLEALGADLARCHTLTEIRDGPHIRPLSLPEDLPVLEHHLRERQAVLAVIDPFMAFLTGRVNSHRDSDIRRVLYGLKKLAEDTQAALLLVRHLNKNQGGRNPLYRGGGSIGIIGAARIAWLVGVHPEDEHLRVLCWLKGNLGTPPPSLAYAVTTADGTHQFHWTGVVPWGPDDLLHRSDPGGRPPEAIGDAINFLTTTLVYGPQPAPEVEAMAQLRGISLRTLRRAREELGIQAIAPTKRGGPWKWKLRK